MITRKFSFDPDPFNRFLLFAEGEAAAEGGGDSGGGDEAAVAAAAAAEAAEVEAKANRASDDWRVNIKDEKHRKHAENFTDVPDLVGKHYELRKELSTAIKPLGKDPTEEQVAAYRKSTGIPETVEGYEFAVPEGHEVTDADKAFQASAAEVFHKNNISAESAKALNEWWNGIQSATLEAQIEGDKKYADETEAALKREWPGEEFTRNKAFADQAAARVFGEEIDEVRNIETKDGRFVLDHPAFVKMLAAYGREMQEGRLGGVMTEGERGGIDAEIRSFEQKIAKAQADGDSEHANELYREQQKLYAKAYGAGPVVGSEGRPV